jgi:hypothetical protein
MKQWNRIALAAFAIAFVGCEKPIAPPPTLPSELAPNFSPTLEEPDIYDEEPSAEEPSTGEFPLEEEIPVSQRIAKIHKTENEAWFRSKDLVAIAKMWYFANVANFKLTLRAVSDGGGSYLSPALPKGALHWLPRDDFLELGGKMLVPTSCGHSGESFGEYSVETKAVVPKLGIVTLAAATTSDFARSVYQDVCPPPSGGGGESGAGDGGGSGGQTICYDYYELDHGTGDITFLFSTCPQYLTNTATASGATLGSAAREGSTSPLRRLLSRAAGAVHRARSVALPLAPSSPGPSSVSAAKSGLDRVPFALVERPLPAGAKAVAARRGSPTIPEVILVSPGASAADVALAVASLRGLRKQRVANGSVETVAIPHKRSSAAPELEKWSETILRRFQSAPVVTIENHGPARVVYALLHP